MTKHWTNLKSKIFRDTPSGSGGGVPRSASSYSVQTPDMDDVKESVRQVGRFDWSVTNVLTWAMSWRRTYLSEPTFAKIGQDQLIMNLPGREQAGRAVIRNGQRGDEFNSGGYFQYYTNTKIIYCWRTKNCSKTHFNPTLFSQRVKQAN